VNIVRDTLIIVTTSRALMNCTNHVRSLAMSASGSCKAPATGPSSTDGRKSKPFNKCLASTPLPLERRVPHPSDLRNAATVSLERHA
jgi:hypothetical protein